MINRFMLFVNRLVFYIKTSILSILKDVGTSSGIVILILPFLFSIYFASTIPVSYDEAYTYLHFTIQPFYVSLVFYPAPNNHILHSFLTNITDDLSFFNILFRLRLPAVGASLITWIIAFSFVKRFYSEKVASVVVGISSILFFSLYYSCMARGYAMVTLFFIICLYCIYKIIKNDSNLKYWIFFSLASILGFYTMPSFLYPYVTLNVILIIFNFSELKTIFLVNIVNSIIILFLYMPVILYNGFDALFNNTFVARKSLFQVIEALPAFLSETAGQIVGISYWMVLIFIAVTGILLYLQKKKFELRLWLIFMTAPFVLLILHSVIPFHRTFLYYGFVIIFFGGISLSPYFYKVPNILIITLLIIIQLVGIVNFSMNISEYETFNTYAHDMNKRIIEKDKTYYINNSFCIYNLQFEMIANGIDYNEKLCCDWGALQVSADTINNYDYVIIDREKDESKLRKPYYSNYWQNVYKKE